MSESKLSMFRAHTFSTTSVFPPVYDILSNFLPVDPSRTPPVCKLMDYKTEQYRRMKQQKAKRTRKQQIKEVHLKVSHSPSAWPGHQVFETAKTVRSQCRTARLLMRRAREYAHEISTNKGDQTRAEAVTSVVPLWRN